MDPIQFLLQFFNYDHLPGAQASLSKRFHDVAELLSDELPSNPETTVCLRKLLEAKDAAVRASFVGDVKR